MSIPVQVFDALANEIILGNRYGYSSNSNGFIRIVTGIANNVTATGKVTLHDLHIRRFLYNKPTTVNDGADKISVTSNILFPVDSFNA